jgi:hypothetical protein
MAKASAPSIAPIPSLSTTRGEGGGSYFVKRIIGKRLESLRSDPAGRDKFHRAANPLSSACPRAPMS